MTDRDLIIEVCTRCRICGQRPHPGETCNENSRRTGQMRVMSHEKDDATKAAPEWLRALAMGLKEWEEAAIRRMIDDLDSLRLRAERAEGERDRYRAALESIANHERLDSCYACSRQGRIAKSALGEPDSRKSLSRGPVPSR